MFESGGLNLHRLSPPDSFTAEGSLRGNPFQKKLAESFKIVCQFPEQVLHYQQLLCGAHLPLLTV